MVPEAPSPDQLRAALREIAAAELPDVIEQARHGARARATARIEDVLVGELMQAVALPRDRPAQPSPSPEPERQPQREPERQPGPAGPERTAGEAWWAYCVLSPGHGRAIAPLLEGIEPGTQVELVADGELAALVSAVPLAEYDDERLREHLEDLAWVERTARAHEGVLDRVLRDATIVPLRLCTIYRDHDGVRRLLRENTATLVESLAAVDGSIELGLKVFGDPWAAPAVPAAEAGDDGPGAGDQPGAAYLARRQHERTRAARAVELRPAYNFISSAAGVTP